MSFVVRTIVLFFFLISSGFANENLFYLLRNNSPDVFANLEKNHQKVDIVVSQAYQINQDGTLWGYVNPKLLNFVNEYHLKLMPMVTNTRFDSIKTHKFLKNTKAQERAIHSLVVACLDKHYYGVQFDFEMVSLRDRNALTHFYQAAAAALHKHNFVVSFAIAPIVSDNPQPSSALKELFLVWQGAYDLKALGEASDFVTVMTYNQHTDGTTPGPMASFPWVEQTIKYILRFIPAQKLSLGLATYSSYWSTRMDTSNHGRKLAMHTAEISYAKVQSLLQKHHAVLHWDERNKANFASYECNWLDEYLFVEDGRSFKEKLALIKQYNLRGISVFRLGIEDPKIWESLAS